MQLMKAAIFVEPGRIVLDKKPIPEVGPLDGLSGSRPQRSAARISTGEYPVEKGLTVGHEPVGVIEKLGSAVKGFSEGRGNPQPLQRPAGNRSARC